MKNVILILSLVFFVNVFFAQITLDSRQKMKKNLCVTASYSPDGKYLVSGSSSYLNVFYSGSTDPTHIIKTDFGIIDKIQFVDNENIVVTGSRKSLKKTLSIEAYNVSGGTRTAKVDIDSDLKKISNVISLGNEKQYAILANGKCIVSLAKNIEVISSKTYTIVHYNLNTKFLYLGASDGSIDMYNTETNSIIKSVPISLKEINSLTTSPSGSLVACSDSKGAISVLSSKEDYKSFKVTSANNKSNYTNLKFSYDEQYLASTYKFAFQIWNIENKNLLVEEHSRNKGVLSNVTFDPKGKYLSVSGFESKKIDLWNCLSLNISPYIELKDGTDKTPPQVVLTNPKVPKDKVTVTQEEINLQGLVIDNMGVQEVKVNGQKASLSATGDFDVKLNLAIGENKVAIEATDVNGNTSVKKVSIIRKDFDLDALSLESKNHMLIISIDKYKHWPQLNNAVADANQLEEILKSKYGFEEANVIQVQDTLANRQGIINGFKELIGKVGPNDNVVVYFSGHGYFDAELGEGYWIPVDAEKGADGDYLPNSFMMQLMKKVNSKHLFLVADACFSGSLFNNSNRGYTENVGSYKSRWGLASGRLEYVSDGKIGEHSPFNKYLVEYLVKNDKKEFSVSEIVQYVKIHVANETNQSPIGNPLGGLGDEGGEFIFKVK